MQSPIATLTGVEDRGGGAASLCQDSALFITAQTNTSKKKLERCYIYKDTKLRRRRGRRKIIRGSIGGHVARAAKALVVSELVVIFHAGHRKSLLVRLGAVSVANIFTVEIGGVSLA